VGQGAGARAADEALVHDDPKRHDRVVEVAHVGVVGTEAGALRLEGSTLNSTRH
jgi:hypothetical protein